MTEEKILYKDLSYKIQGILFEAHNELGRFCNEQQVCDCLKQCFKKAGIVYEWQKVLPPSFAGEASGRNRVDFLIEEKLLLEIKCKRFLTKDDYYQTKRYLVALNKKLGLLVNFRDQRLLPKRILNSDAPL